MNVRFQMKDYRLVLGLKRTWIIAVVVGLIQLGSWAIRNHHSWYKYFWLKLTPNIDRFRESRSQVVLGENFPTIFFTKLEWFFFLS
jgi:hypothetical protein